MPLNKKCVTRDDLDEYLLIRVFILIAIGSILFGIKESYKHAWIKGCASTYTYQYSEGVPECTKKYEVGH